jgi:DNA-directed RNA polymerase specialized sigma24 family protein
VRLAYALSGSRLVAEDIAQDGFLRAFHDWPRIRHPSAWVRKVAVRRAGRTVQRRLLEARALARLAEGTVKAQLHRGRQALAIRLAGVREDDHDR